MSERQIIDAQGNFRPPFPLPSSSPSLQYTIISVVGCQSGGKSTLLNAAFNTSFPVLDAAVLGRRRTTLGVWAASTPSLVLLDVEGADSRERGEGAIAFQTRTALFALALSDVVLVNMWMHDVGRYSAANYELFETVFAHAKGLRKGRSKVKLVVVVRDLEDGVELREIGGVLARDLRGVWVGVGRLEKEFEQSFDLRIVGLPHLVYGGDRFHEEAKKLGNAVAMMKTNQAIPMEGLGTFAREVWLQICEQTGGMGQTAEFSLDLPRHVLLTAYFKAGEVVKEVLDGQIGTKIDSLRADIEMSWNKPLESFAGRMDQIAKEAFKEYSERTNDYKAAAESVQKRKVELGVALVQQAADLRERYLSVCREFCRKGFDDEFRPVIAGTSGFERNARRLINSHVNKYKKLEDAGRIPKVLREFLPTKEHEDSTENEEETNLVDENGVEILDTPDGYSSDETMSGVNVDEYSVEAFKKELRDVVEERRRLGEIMLPGGTNFAPALPKPEPWWKGLLIRAAILLINYLQATQGQRAALKQQRKHEKDFPHGPTL